VIEKKIPRFGWQLVAITIGRLFLNTGLRMVYPFAPAFARGLDVPLTAVYRIVALRNIAGFFSPVFSPLSARFGRKAVMMGSLFLFAIGCAAVVAFPSIWTFALAMGLLALTKVNYDPSMQAYVGDAVPYAQRGKALAATEYSWALALLVGAPAVGLAIQVWGWSAPFFWLALLSLIAVLLLWRLLPRLGKTDAMGIGLSDTFRVLAKFRVIWAAFFYMTLVMTANETLFIVYGDWMERSFGLTLATLGLASAIIGGSEIVGETFAGWSVDRFGKRPVIITTGLLNALLYVVLPFTNADLTMTLITLFALFMMFEITVVGGIPLMTELVPKHRAVVMSVVVAAMSVGRTVGAFLGPVVLAWGGFVLSGVVSAVVMGTAVIILVRWIREGVAIDD
jgi:predicted MFS family arabinose efflux permease